MKTIKKYIGLTLIGGALALLPSCNDFLDREPLDGLTDQNYWASEANVKTYSWLFYNQFMAYGKGTATSAEFYFQSTTSTVCANITDDLSPNVYLAFQNNAGSSNTEWKECYDFIRRANVMIKRIPDVPMSDEAKQHWEGVARFFRAYGYFKLVQRFGDVPYYDHFITDPEKTDEVFVKSTNRNEVMDKVREDINISIEKMRDRDKNNPNIINKHVGLALKARICLYEGTYRKYHNKGDGKAFLTDAKDAANKIIKSDIYSIPSTPGSFKAVYNSEDLNKSTEVILYKEYLLGVQANSIQSYTNTSTLGNGMTKAAFDSYVCSDGLPVSQSPLYKGDKTLGDALTDRDSRLLATVDSEGISYPAQANSISRSRKSSTGYVVSLFYNEASPNVTTTGQNTIDAPIFSYPEVLLNYAEACAELGNIAQVDLNISINQLRARAGLPSLIYLGADNVQVNGIEIVDPKRESSLEVKTGKVSSIIWEIRRERRVELMTWTSMRYYDLMRWKKGAYLDYTENPDANLGAYLGTVPAGDIKTKLNADGYIIAYPNQNRTFDTAKNYLNAIPTGQIQLYSNEGINLPQNPGWGN